MIFIFIVFKENYPARSTFQVGKLPLVRINMYLGYFNIYVTFNIYYISLQGALIEIEVIALTGEVETI